MTEGTNIELQVPQTWLFCISFQAFMVGSAKNNLLGYHAMQTSLQACSKIPSEYQNKLMMLYGVIFHEAII